MTAFSHHRRPDDLTKLLDLTVRGDDSTAAMATLQMEGIAALHNILCDGDVAFLADEVGMGKTYQAMGLAATLWNDQPDARVLFISPRENLQVKWIDDYRRFFADNYRRPQGLGDDRTSSVLFGQPVHRPVKFDNLRAWLQTLGRPEPMAPFLRHTSFTRPVFLPSQTTDVDAVWTDVRSRFERWGLFDVPRPEDLEPVDASLRLNFAFGDAVNRRLTGLSGERPYFDLVVLDECQCLRNPRNQTNQVLHRMLSGHVAKWLFMSATPSHSGPGDIPRIVNHYPGVGDVVDPDLTEDLPAMQQALQRFMVRRPRTYLTSWATTARRVDKTEYRDHDLETWAVDDEDMSAFSTLAMGLVQKELVEVLDQRNNRYRIGFLSSFESLQQSVRHLEAPERSGEAEPEERRGDWQHDTGVSEDAREAPDAGFIDRLVTDFDAKFGLPLPHAKVDAVINRIAPDAFGTDEAPGGIKHLVFTRRLSTVEVLRDRLQRRYLATIERRVERCWDSILDWDGPANTDAIEVEDDEIDPETVMPSGDGDRLRQAMGEKAWLGRYRATFRTTGRNALVFEDGWLSRLCAAGGVPAEQAIDQLPDALWAESWVHASRASGARRSQHRAARLRYLAVHGVKRHPEAFGLSQSQARPWQTAYASILHEHLEAAGVGDSDPRRDPELFTQPTLWSSWDQTFPTGPLALPAADPRQVSTEQLVEELCRRQVVRTLLGQVFRLTDTLVDLYYADERGGQRADQLPRTFLQWGASEDPCAHRLQNDVRQWSAHLRLIIDSSLDGAGKPWTQLARQESWPQLFNLTAVLGVTGGSGGHKTATRQFRTPSVPRVIVCTDTLKEGVDLHLFCDRVLHYGVAWSSGDLEQRVGRVDRYFSQVERRLRDEGSPPEVHLHVGYPHVVSSLERSQVLRVRERQRRAELLMDSPLAGAREEATELSGDDLPVAIREAKLEPFHVADPPEVGCPVPLVSAADARAVKEHYAEWYAVLVSAVQDRGWSVSPPADGIVQQATIGGADRTHELEWTFDAPLQRYVLTLTAPEWSDEQGFSGGWRRRLRDRAWTTERFVRVLVPRLNEDLDEYFPASVIRSLDGEVPVPDEAAPKTWDKPLSTVASDDVVWPSAHKATLDVSCGARSHAVTIYCYEHGVRIVGVVASRQDLRDRGPWTGVPSMEDLRYWAQGETGQLGLGYLDAQRDGLVFGIHVLHDRLSEDARARLVEQVAWRADAWEAVLTGQDVR